MQAHYCQPEKGKSMVEKVLKRNVYFDHPENILLAVLVNAITNLELDLQQILK